MSHFGQPMEMKADQGKDIMQPEIVDASIYEAQTRAEYDISITTAKRFPRSVAAFRQRTTELIKGDPAMAAKCEYNLPRAGGVKGPSVRLAEIVITEWGNCRYGARVIDVGARHVTAQAVVYDMERNITATWETRRRITTKDGKRFNDDMITVTANAAAAIAFRNAVFRLIPQGIWGPLYELSRKVTEEAASKGDPKRKWNQAVNWFSRYRISEADLLAFLEIESPGKVAPKHIVDLEGIATAIDEGTFNPREMAGYADKINRQSDIQQEVAEVFGSEPDEQPKQPEPSQPSTASPPPRQTRQKRTTAKKGTEKKAAAPVSREKPAEPNLAFKQQEKPGEPAPPDVGDGGIDDAWVNPPQTETTKEEPPPAPQPQQPAQSQKNIGGVKLAVRGLCMQARALGITLGELAEIDYDTITPEDLMERDAAIRNVMKTAGVNLD